MKRGRLERDPDGIRDWEARTRKKQRSAAQVRALDRARAIRWGRTERLTNVCPECGEEFRVKPSESLRRKFCSRACAAVAKARRLPEERRGEANPNYRHGDRAGVRDRSGEKRWRTALKPRCEHPTCTSPTRSLQLHHVVYRQHVRKEHGDEWDPRNALTLCVRCHQSHHKYGRVFPLALLPDAALEFAFGLLGPAAEIYLRRRYAGPATARFYELAETATKAA